MSFLSSVRSGVRLGAASLTLCALLIGGTAIAGPLAHADFGAVTATAAVNIRSGPATSYPVVGVLAKGATLVQSDVPVNGWVPVTYKGVKAWISGTYVTGEQAMAESTSSSGATGTAVTTANLNVRSGPGITYAIVSVLPKGVAVTLTGKVSSTWSQITQNGTLRWVSTAYLTTSTSATSLPPVTGYGRATTDLMIRTTSGSDYTSLGDIPKGTILSLTGTVTNGMAQIIWKDALRWVNNSYVAPVDATSTVPAPPVPATIGTRYATTLLDIRTTSGTDSITVTSVPKGTALKITGVVENGRAQVVYIGAVRWVTALYLSVTAPAGTTVVTPPATPSEMAAKVIAYATAQLGKPYVWGATGPNSFDCSGLSLLAYRTVGITLPRVSSQQYQVGQRVTLSQLRPGDLVFYYTPVSHVGIYIGNGMIIHAANPRAGIKYASVTSMPFRGGSRMG
ncbi:MAG TPA: SH3 domain-containing protein [Propionibacteriaceae bacterium]|nr:SH3 domain-containing protein [Propionibacteriaceae bacterium]